MTRDNLRKRHIIKPHDCVFCPDEDSISHLFFSCVVAKNLWAFISVYFKIPMGHDYELVARFWISNNKNSVLTVSSAVLWCCGNIGTLIIFNNPIWMSITQVRRLILKTIRFWAALMPEKDRTNLMNFVDSLKEFIRRPLMILGV